MATALASLLPSPAYAPAIEDDEDDIVQVPTAAPSQSVIIRTPVPPYGQRQGWKPASPDDFGVYECVLVGRLQLNMLQATEGHTRNAMSRNIH